MDENDSKKKLKQAIDKAEKEFQERLDKFREAIFTSETETLAAVQNWAEGKTVEAIKRTAMDDLIRQIKEKNEDKEAETNKQSINGMFTNLIQDEKTVKLAQEQANHPGNYPPPPEEPKEATRNKSIPRVADTRGLDPSRVNVDDLIDQKINELGKTLNENLKSLLDKKMKEQRYGGGQPDFSPHGTNRNSREYDRQKRDFEQTKKWIEYSKPIAKGFEEKIKEQKLFGHVFKFAPIRKVVTKLHTVDEKLTSFLREVGEAEIVITKDNIVSKTARKLLGVRLPYEPDYVRTDKGKKTRWAAMLDAMKKDPSYREADPDRIINNNIQSLSDIFSKQAKN